MPKPFPWESQPDTDEAYIVVDPLLLETIRQLCCTDKDMQPILRMVMSVAHIDPVDGPLVIGVKLTRDLEGCRGRTPPPT